MARQEIDVNVNVNSKQAQTNLNTVSKDLDKVADSTKEVKSEFQEMPGVLGQAQKGVAGLGKAFKALLANPVFLVITALVTAVTALGKAFVFTEKGADKMRNTMKGVGAGFDEAKRRVGELAGGLIKLFKGNPEEAFRQMGQAVSGFGDSVQEAYNIAFKLSQLMEDLKYNTADISLATSQLNVQLQNQREIAIDINKSAAERLLAAEKAIEIQKQINLQASVLAEKRREAAAAQYQLDQGTKDQAKSYVELRAAEEAVFQAEAAGTRAIIRLKKEQLAVINQTREKEVEINEQRSIDTNIEIEEIERIGQARIDTEELVTDKLKELREEQTQDALYQEQMKQDAIEGIVGMGFATLQTLFGDNFEASKAIAIAETIYNTYKSAVAMLAAGAQVGGPAGIIVGPVSAAAAIVFGAAQVAKIASTKRTTTNVQSSGTPSTRTPSVNTQAQDVINAPPELSQQVSVDNFNNQPPLKAYVVSRDMSSQQDLDRRISDQASL